MELCSSSPNFFSNKSWRHFKFEQWPPPHTHKNDILINWLVIKIFCTRFSQLKSNKYIEWRIVYHFELYIFLAFRFSMQWAQIFSIQIFECNFPSLCKIKINKKLFVHSSMAISSWNSKYCRNCDRKLFEFNVVFCWGWHIFRKLQHYSENWRVFEWIFTLIVLRCLMGKLLNWLFGKFCLLNLRIIGLREETTD